MKLSNVILGLSLAAFVGFASHTFADDTKVAGKKSLENRIAELEAKLKDAGVGGGVKGSGIKVSGYVDTSYLVNLADRSNTGPVAGSSAQNSGRVFDNQFNAFNLNAVKLTIEKAKDNSKFPAGFRVDAIVGEDAGVLANTGNVSDSALFLEQAYVNLGIPVGNGIDVKVGKMVSLIGYEVIESPANWQFSRSDAFRLSPFTQTGVTLGYQFNDMFTTTVGLINGLDNHALGVAGANNSAINFNTDLSLVGRVDVTGPKTAVGDFSAFVAGLFGNDNGAAGSTTSNDQQVFIANVGGNWAKPFGIKPLAFGLDFLYRNDDRAAAGFPAVTADAKALTGYAKWDWNKWTSTSGRFGATWYHTDPTGQVNANAAYTLSPLVAKGATPGLPGETEVYNITLTQAFNVWKDTLVRLEWRHDWTAANNAGFGATAVGAGQSDVRDSQDTIAVNVVYSF